MTEQGKSVSWGPESVMGKTLRILIETKENWEDIRTSINEIFDTNYTYDGIKSAALRQGLTLANREERALHAARLRDRYGTVGGDNVPVFSIKDDGREWIPFMQFGDLHVGSEEFLEEVFLTSLEFAKEEGAYLWGNGDLMETAVPYHMPQTMWGQKCTPRTQVRYIEDKLDIVKERLLGLNPGNHEHRISNVTSMCPLEKVAQTLGCLYMARGGFYNLEVNGIEYKFLTKHGVSFSQNYTTEVCKFAVLYPEVDVVSLGHVHVCDIFDTNEHFTTSTSKEIGKTEPHKETSGYKLFLDGAKREAIYPLGVRTGHALGYSGYVEEKPYKPHRPGFPVLWLNTREKVIYGDASGKFVVPK